MDRQDIIILAVILGLVLIAIFDNYITGNVLSVNKTNFSCWPVGGGSCDRIMCSGIGQCVDTNGDGCADSCAWIVWSF